MVRITLMHVIKRSLTKHLKILKHIVLTMVQTGYPKSYYAIFNKLPINYIYQSNKDWRQHGIRWHAHAMVGILVLRL